MNLKTIQDKLNTEFKREGRLIVFWYDDNGEFSEEIDSLKIEGAKVLVLTDGNVFYTKYLLEYEDRDNSYLIYAPFPKPADNENHLTDMIYYSKQFYADRISLLCADLGIPEKHKSKLEEFAKFWRAKDRVSKFQSLDIDNFNSETIEVGVLAVLVGVKIPSFEEVVKKIILSESYTDNRYLEAFKKMDALNVFWKLCEKYYGYKDESPTIEGLIATLLITYTSSDYEGDLPKSWTPYVSYKKNDIIVLVSTLMNNVLYQDAFDRITEHIAGKIKANEFFRSVGAQNYFKCDTFDIFDKEIVDYMANLMTSNSQPLSVEDSSIVKERGKKKHFLGKYSEHYRALNRADKLMSEVQNFLNDSPKDADETIDFYVSKWSNVDKYYRGFYTAFDKLEPSDSLYELKNLVEAIYSNSYLARQSVSWGDKLEKLDSPKSLKGNKQYEFYRDIVEPAVSRETTVVIISDGFRYEAGIELHGRFKDKVNTKSELGYMISAIPSYTKLGMASLLPHQKISYTENYDVLVDGKLCSSIEQRDKILASHNSNAMAISYSKLSGMSRGEIRDVTYGKELIYIYHNQVDARGDNASTENEVFSASRESMDEIINIIQKLTVDKSISNYIITSDHGYIYKRDKVDESDKLSLSRSPDTFINKRFILSRKELNLECSIQYGMDYIGAENEGVIVTLPRGTDIFKVAGAGQNYVHGGASLQEIIVPMIRVRTERSKQEAKNVEVALTSTTRKITGFTIYLDFIQTENISDTLKPVKVRAYFETEAGEKISDEEFIIADKKNTSPEKRQFNGKFTLKHRKYPKEEKYFLVMIDASSDTEISRHEFIIDIPFSDEFGFGF